MWVTIYSLDVLTSKFWTNPLLRICCFLTCIWASQVALAVKNPPDNAREVRDVGPIPGSGRSPGGGNGNPLQYSCLENPWTEEPSRLQSMESHRVGHNWRYITSKHTQPAYRFLTRSHELLNMIHPSFLSLITRIIFPPVSNLIFFISIWCLIRSTFEIHISKNIIFLIYISNHYNVCIF